MIYVKDIQNETILKRLSDYPVTLGYVSRMIVAAVAISTHMYVHRYLRSYIHNGFTVRFANNILYVRSVKCEQSSRWRFGTTSFVVYYRYFMLSCNLPQAHA